MMKNTIGKITLLLALTVASTAMAAEPALAERHVGRGLTCDACHASMPPKADVSPTKCEGCHGVMAKVAEKTVDADINPHDSHVEAQCFDCHKGHKPPQLICDQCHEFGGMRVP